MQHYVHDKCVMLSVIPADEDIRREPVYELKNEFDTNGTNILGKSPYP